MSDEELAKAYLSHAFDKAVEKMGAATVAKSLVSEAHTPATWKLQFLTDVTTAAGLLAHGKQCKALAKRIGEDAFRMNKELHDRPAAEINAELLAALKGVMTWVSNWDCEFKYDPDWPEDEATYLAAIARAEGVQRDN